MNEEEQNRNLHLESAEQRLETTDPQPDCVKGPDDLSRSDITEIYNAAGIGINFVHDPESTLEQKLEWCEQVFIGIQSKLAAGNPALRPVIRSACTRCSPYIFGSSSWAYCIKNYC